jgi:UDP-N-acetylmuramoyl-L-alanyl-D-glutamate--2,6-diaminopimelate ligase
MRAIGLAELRGYLAARTSVRLVGGAGREVRCAGIAVDSRAVKPGDLFVAERGERVDSHAFIADAIRRGAAAVLAERAERADVPFLVVPETRTLVGPVAAYFLGEPSAALRVVGVTGTNGKTTTAYCLWRILSAADGVTGGLLGTVENILGPAGRARPTTTTPGPLPLQESFAAMVAGGARSCVMEVSSHSILQGRVAGVRFGAGILTNIQSDHLDYHKTFEAYREAKTLFFERLPADAVAVLNADDPSCEFVARRTAARVVRFARDGFPGLTTRALSGDGLVRAALGDGEGAIDVTTRAWGRHNAENICGAIACARALGVPWDAVRAGVADFVPPAGRLEEVPAPGFRVFVDFAHTDSALARMLDSMRPVAAETGGRLIVVFGCGGDRDATKRPAMGKTACARADAVYVTSDNPRTEDPRAIIDQVLAGIDADGTDLHVVADRERAIREALADAREGDVVVIAGKGHEDYQIIGTRKIRFDDREVARRVLRERGCARVSV